MSLLSFIQYQYLKRYTSLINTNRFHAIECQQQTFASLINAAKNTAFGKEHSFNSIKTYDDFKRNVPLRIYEDFNLYIERILNREPSVLYPGLPAFFGKSSGTTDKPKLIPVTNESLQCTQYAALYMLSNLSAKLNSAKFMGSKVLALTDQQNFENVNGFLCGAISSIKSSSIPKWAKRFSFPPTEINNIEDPSKKISATIKNIQNNNIRMATALPVYLSYFLQQFELITLQKFKDIFPAFSVVFLSGMNYEPYENLLRKNLGDDVLMMENYSATEGNFAYQTEPHVKGMEIICNQGIFYEFVELKNVNNKDTERLCLNDVQTGKPYSIIISTNNGLWAYVMNDIVEFISIQPYRLIVSGRLKDIFSPFGEQMLPIQAEQAIAETCNQTNKTLIDFIVVPDFNHSSFRYKCYAAFEQANVDTFQFATILHQQLSKHNSYYNDLVKTGVLTHPEIIVVNRNFFSEANNSKGFNISAQQKITHLINNKETISKLENIVTD
ncbi:MAG: GH3 auxin-responsive promoter family protein [Parafilimonas sp.]